MTNKNAGKNAGHPILFIEEGIRAILAWRKMQTRRVIKVRYRPRRDPTTDSFRRCPYGQVGDLLWVNMGGLLFEKGRSRPKWASRIWLEITGIRAERVQDITEEDAIAEGVGYGFQCNAGWPDYQHIKNGKCTQTQDCAQMSYATLWDSLYAKRGFGWDTNPWVWVIEFKRVERGCSE